MRKLLTACAIGLLMMTPALADSCTQGWLAGPSGPLRMQADTYRICGRCDSAMGPTVTPRTRPLVRPIERAPADASARAKIFVL
jgi:hypothetical protein